MPKFNAEKAYRIVMECYQSGLTIRQWLAENDIGSSTFYNWVRKLREQPCYNIPPMSGSKRDIPYKQDIVQVNIIPDEQVNTMTILEHGPQYPRTQDAGMKADKTVYDNAAITIQFADATIQISNNADPRMLISVLRSVREALC
ncbi:MAG: transposase [Clostridiales bacterium]|jgi:transposase-like protein|nr:transposase [Clostridiales bacterium]